MLRNILLIAVAGLSQVAVAQTAFSNGGPDYQGGSEMTGWIQADGFSGGITFTTVRFWDLETSPGYQGSIHWQVYSDSGGQPGLLLRSGDATPTHVSTGWSIAWFDEYQNDFSVGTITLPAGEYWLALHNGPLAHTSFDSMYWESTSPGNGATGQEQDLSVVSGWADNTCEDAFELISIPEPQAYTLAALGLVAFAIRRRVAKQK